MKALNFGEVPAAYWSTWVNPQGKRAIVVRSASIDISKDGHNIIRLSGSALCTSGGKAPVEHDIVHNVMCRTTICRPKLSTGKTMGGIS